VAAFDRDRVSASSRRLGWGGVLLGLAGAVEGWAIVPVLVLLAVIVVTGPAGRARWRRAGWFTAGVSAGFVVPVAPFAAASPHGFYRSLITAQVGPRLHPMRVGAVARLRDLAGLTGLKQLPPGEVVVIAVVIALAIIALTAAAWYLTRTPPPPLDAFALAATAAVTGMLWWPAQFHYHFAAFLAPFLAAAIALPAARCASALAATGPAAAQWLPLGVPFLAAALLALFAVIQVGTEGGLRPYISPAAITATSKAIPRGSCVVSDEVSYLLMANRFSSDVPGCSQLVDGLGTDLALSGGLTPATGAGRVRAVAATWRSAFSHAGYALLSVLNARRVAWTPALRAYFRAHFALAARDARGDALYARTPASRG